MKKIIKEKLSRLQNIDVRLIEASRSSEAKYERVGAQIIKNALNGKLHNDSVTEIKKSFSGSESLINSMIQTITEVNESKKSLDVADKEELCKMLESKIELSKVREENLPEHRPRDPIASAMESKSATLG